MIEYQKFILDPTSKMIIRDRSDEETALIELFVQTPGVKTVAAVPWRYKIDDLPATSWKSYGLIAANHAQKVAGVFVTDDMLQLTFYIGATGNNIFGGPANLTITIQRGLPKAHITVGLETKIAIPYVCIEPDIWVPAEAHIHTPEEGWKLAI